MTKRAPCGIGGWLVAFVVYVGATAVFVPCFIMAEKDYIAGDGALFYLLCVAGAVISLLHAAVLVLLFLRDRRFVTLYTVTVGALFVFSLLQGIPYAEIFWLIYLNRSERVRRTFAPKRAARPAAAPR